MKKIKQYFLFVFIITFFLITPALISCGRIKLCDPETREGCPSGTVCQRVGPDKGMCLDDCESDANNPCGLKEVCYRFADDTFACIEECSADKANACPDGWACASVADGRYVCRPECDNATSGCDEGEVCQALSDGIAVCVAECDPNNESDCGESLTCELRTDGKHACYEPVFLKGNVFDSATENSIEGSHVIAIDDTGAAATDVAITSADGMYELQVPVVRETDGTLSEGIYTLRISASDYLPYPHGIRPAIPIDATQATHEESGQWVLQNTSTQIALIKLPADKQGRGSISGSILGSSDNATPDGVLVVLEGGTDEPVFSFSDKSGTYTIFNVPVGTWEVHGYKEYLQLDSVEVSLSGGEDKTGIDLDTNDKSYGTVTGSINIVNAPGGSATSVVLIPESTFNETFVKGEVPPGLRAPKPPESPNITSSFTITGVPDGNYVVLAAFENDFLVRDPDPSIAGTQILHIQVPDGPSYDINIGSSFKVTEALGIVSPGANVPELISGNPTFIWKDDSGEDKYSIVVYNAFGDEVWSDDNLPRVTGSENVTVSYGGSRLGAGMYYQFRVTSWKRGGAISQTEDLLGVFYIAGE